MIQDHSMKSIVIGGGCFWCTEAVFKMFAGVISVTPGYAGGRTPNPTYEQVSGGTTAHAEVVRVTFDPAMISLMDILTIFFASHDPTTQDRQGNDVGTHYRSIILYADAEQKDTAEKVVADLRGDDIVVVTEIASLDMFYEAEDYHKDYYAKNTTAPYCHAIINPKLAKVQEKFTHLLVTHKK